MRDAKDDGRAAFKILKEHYAGSGKPRIITLYNQLTTLKKQESETVTEYIIRAETSSTALKGAGEQISDALLVAMVLKGLPDEYKAFVAITQSNETVQNFQKFKQALRNFEETEKTRSNKSGDNTIMRARDGQVTCFKCHKPGHKAFECHKQQKEKKWYSVCKSPSHTRQDLS